VATLQKLILLVILTSHSILFSQKSEMEDNFYHYPFGLEVNITPFTKIRLKFEYRLNENNALVLSGATHYGSINPGVQTYLEYRRYFKPKVDSELFVAGKLGAGQSFTFGGNYGLIGASFGQKIYLGQRQSFYFLFSEGFKVCPTLKGDIEAEPNSGFRGLFYAVGPGSFIDVNINFGFSF
jgi:hypothetical protein